MTDKKQTYKNERSIRKSRSKTMKKLRCSPNPLRKKNTKEYSCLPNESKIKLRDLWNARHPDAFISTDNPDEIWYALKNYMKDTCNKESCWLKQSFAKDEMRLDLEDSFAPEAPIEWKKNPNEWLSSIDILQVMQQYEKAYKCFEFIGPTPIDFDSKEMYGGCVWDELCNFNLKNQIQSEKTKIGIIFNLDKHDKDGSHWVSMFINIKKKMIFYYDSAGVKIPRLIKKFANRVMEQGSQLEPKIKFEFDQNYPVEHQFKDSECGVYSLYFIVHMLEDKITGHYLKTHVIKDKYMQRFRKVYFNDEL